MEDLLTTYDFLGSQLDKLVDLESKKNYTTNDTLKSAIAKYINMYSDIIIDICEKKCK
ncbi:MAG: hypothetical protein [Wendovervirus sonii]|uniref:Uncharacterized protein n=1 Tax=phage Lak_Megaphage_Sonny TaxID=3109229 RepID=A0ABZ0Z3L3_9CAUD|nr:MAG: hypothetical protein [phage Lak_Megaphage_Sonny]